MEDKRCSKFCKGGINTNNGLVAGGLSSEVTKASFDPEATLKKVTPVGSRHTCPLGCKVMANDDMVINNLIGNGMPLYDICQQGYNY